MPAGLGLGDADAVGVGDDVAVGDGESLADGDALALGVGVGLVADAAVQPVRTMAMALIAQSTAERDGMAL